MKYVIKGIVSVYAIESESCIGGQTLTFWDDLFNDNMNDDCGNLFVSVYRMEGGVGARGQVSLLVSGVGVFGPCRCRCSVSVSVVAVWNRRVCLSEVAVSFIQKLNDNTQMENFSNVANAMRVATENGNMLAHLIKHTNRLHSDRLSPVNFPSIPACVLQTI